LTDNANARGPVGIIAGWGRFPVLIAQEARREGLSVFVIGLEGITDPAIEREASAMAWIKLGQLDRPIQEMRKAGVTKAVIAGRVHHVKIFGGFVPDLRAIRLLAGLKDKRADTILGAIASEFAKDGIEFQNSAAYLSRFIPEPGVLTKKKPTAADKKDIELGWRVAKSIAGHDVGQTVVVRAGAIMAVEAMEGTDACILRAGELARAGKTAPELVVVKVAKPKQDFRFDLPVAGLDTLKTLEAAGARALAVEARKTVLLDREKFVAEADRLGVSITAVESGD
jgi:UDP-2,3-diacylglucosamine hydrolase